MFAAVQQLMMYMFVTFHRGWESSDVAGASSLQVDILWSANTNISCPLFITTNLECLQAFCSLDKSKCTARSKASRCFLMIRWRHLQLTFLKTMSINSHLFFFASVSEHLECSLRFGLAWIGGWLGIRTSLSFFFSEIDRWFLKQRSGQRWI
jgi:hypothetical protein